MTDHNEIGEVTAILDDWKRGHGELIDRLMPVVVNRLRELARHHLRKYSGSSVGSDLQPTEVVNEAYLKLRNFSPDPERMNRSEDFYALCAETIKCILIDYSRRKSAAKRGSGIENASLDDTINLSWVRDNKSSSLEDVVTFQEVLERLREKHERESQALSLKYYVGLTDEEIARSLNVSVPKVRRALVFARAWVRREIDRMTSDIIKQAVQIKNQSDRDDYVAHACKDNEALLRDVRLLIGRHMGRGS